MCTGPRAVPGEGAGGPEPALSWLEGLGANVEEAAQRKTDRRRQEAGALPVPEPRQRLVCVLCWFSGVPCSSIEAFVSSLGKSRAFPSQHWRGVRWGWVLENPCGHGVGCVQQAIEALVRLPSSSSHKQKTKGCLRTLMLPRLHPDPTPGASSRRQLCSHHLGSLENGFQLHNPAPGASSAASSLL